MSEIHGGVSGHPDDGKEPAAGSVGVHLPWHPIKAIEVDEKTTLCASASRVSGALWRSAGLASRRVCRLQPRQGVFCS